MTRETDPRWMNHLSEWEANVVRVVRDMKKNPEIEDMFDLIRHLAQLLDTAHLPEVQGTFMPWPGESSHTQGNTCHTVGDVDLHISPMPDLHGEIKLTDEDELYLKPITYYKIGPTSRNLSEVKPSQQMEPVERIKIEPALARTFEDELYGPVPWGTYYNPVGDWEHGVMEYRGDIRSRNEHDLNTPQDMGRPPYTGTYEFPLPVPAVDYTTGSWIAPDGEVISISEPAVPSSTTTTLAKGTVVVDDDSNEPHSDA